MHIEFSAIGLTLTAEVDYEPFQRGVYSGPPENCYPDEGGYAEITKLECAGKDALFLLDSDHADDINEAAYQACCGDVESMREQAEEDRAAARAEAREWA